MNEWRAYYAVEPFGSERDNWHAGLIASAIVNAFRGKQRPVGVDQFMFKDEKTRAEEQVRAFFDRFDKAFKDVN